MLTERVRILRDKTIRPPEICTEKAYWYTVSHKETAGESHQIRRAKAMAKVMENMTVFIDEGELIVGRLTSKIRGGILNPESNIQWLVDELDTIHTREWDHYGPLSEKEKDIIRQVADYWSDKSLIAQYHKRLPPETAEREHFVHESGAFCGVGFHIGHQIAGYDVMLKKGIGGMIAEIDEKIRGLSYVNPEDAHKIENYTAWKINLQAIITFANRYSQLAKEMAKAETDPGRKAELEAISKICRKVPEKPAETFWEAMQAIWFAYAGIMLEGCSAGISFGRVDQYLYPYYRHDIDNGIMTEEQIEELCGLFNVRINQHTIPLAAYITQAFGGHALTCDFTVGGIDERGNDAVNELSYIFLDAQLDTRTRADDLVIRVNFNNPMRFLMKALEVSISLNGKIKWVGDESMMFALMKEGKTLEDARNYAVEGCFQPTIPGKSIDVPGGPMNTPLFLELALNRGVSRVTGKQIGPDTGDPREFRTYGELWNAFRTQVEALAVHSNIIKTTDWRLRQESNLATCASPFYEGCMETGLDYIEGGTAPYCTHTTLIGGAPNTGNGLAALKKCVYEEQTLTMEEVLEALAHDFEGYQDVQKTLLDVPKFGNDIPYVDRIVNDVISVCSDNITKYHNCNGMKVTASLATVTNNVPLGAVVGATPDGRRAHMPIAEGGISPYQGTNISGLTPTLNSVSRLDFGKFTSGAVLNVKLSPALVNKEENRKQMAEIIRTYFQSGGMLVQFNVVDTETLREAQKHPEEYKDLLVRVSTYSAYFTELSPVLQNDIIARSEIEAM